MDGIYFDQAGEFGYGPGTGLENQWIDQAGDYGYGPGTFSVSPPTLSAPPSSSWTGFLSTPANVLNQVQSGISTLAGISVARDRYAAERDVAKANLEAQVAVARYGAAGTAAKAAGAAREAQISAMYPQLGGQPSMSLGLLLLIGAVAWAASKS